MGLDQMQLDELSIRPNGFRPNGNVPFIACTPQGLLLNVQYYIVASLWAEAGFDFYVSNTQLHKTLINNYRNLTCSCISSNYDMN